MKRFILGIVLTLAIGFIPICAEAAESEKITKELQKVLEVVQDDYQIDIIVRFSSEEGREAFIQLYLNDDRIYSISKYYYELSFLANKEEILLYTQLDTVVEVATYRILPDKTIYNLGIMTLSKDQAQVIKEAYIKKLNNPRLLPEEITIWYYGTYGGYDVVNMSVSGIDQSPMEGQVVVDNYYFDYGYASDADQFYVYKDSSFTHVKDAYEQELISDEDLAGIARSFPGAYQIIDGKYFLVLQDKTELEIKKAYIRELQLDHTSPSIVDTLTVDDIEIYDYYGTYDGRAVFTIGYEEKKSEQTGVRRICGYPFEVAEDMYENNFYTWGDGSLLTLRQTLEVQWLTPESVCEILQLRNAVISPSDFSQIFEDIHFKSDWFANSAYKAYIMGLMTGMTTDSFAPYERLSRAQFATILYRLDHPNGGGDEAELLAEYEKGIFGDVKGNEWYAAEVLWAYENGIVSGYEDGNFGPADPITREQIALMLYRYGEYKDYFVMMWDSLVGFKDRPYVSEFALEAVKWSVKAGVITGNDGYLKPQDYCTRAECAAMVTRFAEKYEY